VNNFDRLHPAIQYHIVNSLGWRELRPFQDEVIPEVLGGKHLVILAPTAGGKTEAAFLPILSRMLSEDWAGLSVLYICPIKALLNDLDARLSRYCTLVGRKSALWHGDVKASGRTAIIREPPNCLLTTPESLEVILTSTKTDSHVFFRHLKAVVVDEIHAFAGDDRGWHLLSVLERISRLAGSKPQRIGLSATVGNPESLLGWLAGSSRSERKVIRPLGEEQAEASIQLDYVGSLQNAATVISRLHRGEKRLVFVDSRSQAEQLASHLRDLEVATHVTHSSLSKDQRRGAEEAFSMQNDCVIVATSVLELGIDIGSLDRVIQIDSPSTVSSFLQRMGRTGRRSGTTRNCLFLATEEDSLLQAAGLIDLWSNGYVEAIEPPPDPFHILAQQLMALALQERGIGKVEWFSWVSGVPAFARMSHEQVQQIVSWMLENEILGEDQGILWFGLKGEKVYGRRNFMDILSVFSSPPLVSVVFGNKEIGFVDCLTFVAGQDSPQIILLGGRAWQVNHVDWNRRKAFVEPVNANGHSLWRGTGRRLRYELCQSIKNALASDNDRAVWSKRAAQKMTELRQAHSWLELGASHLVFTEGKPVRWWTFGGTAANAMLCEDLMVETGSPVSHDAFCLTFDPCLSPENAKGAIDDLRRRGKSQAFIKVDDKAIEGLKFSACLPEAIARSVLQRRLVDDVGANKVLAEPLTLVIDNNR
jgi:ATP-dependent Lhr-like helicase